MRVLVLVVVLTVAGCAGSSEPEGPPVLDRIDGPAVVDPSFDPFATTPTSTVAGG